MAQPYFTRETYRFLLELDGNNDRAWFAANKDRFEEHVRRPALRFIADFGAHLRRISPHFEADPRPVGGSLFRIQRDIRFSADKSPYKTHCGIQFRHEAGRDVHAPGFYLHIEPGDSLAALGIWHPDTPTLRRIRQAIADQPRRWRQALTTEPFASHHERFGDRLSRVPRGFAPDHPAAEELKWKDYGSAVALTQKQVLAKDFPEHLARVWAEGTPMLRFLCAALDLSF